MGLFASVFDYQELGNHEALDRTNSPFPHIHAHCLDLSPKHPADAVPARFHSNHSIVHQGRWYQGIAVRQGRALLQRSGNSLHNMDLKRPTLRSLSRAFDASAALGPTCRRNGAHAPHPSAPQISNSRGLAYLRPCQQKSKTPVAAESSTRAAGAPSREPSAARRCCARSRHRRAQARQCRDRDPLCWR